jgi:hypothetical protein
MESLEQVKSIRSMEMEVQSFKVDSERVLKAQEEKN